MNERTITSFFNSEYKQYSQHKNFSQIANIMSGLNFSSNKVLYTLYSKNIIKFQKTETVANITALETEYLGGSSNLNGVIFSNIKQYVGGNNLSLIEKKGDTGSRLNNTCAAPRYNFVKKSSIYDVIFRKIDTNIIERYNFEGHDIEYKFMLFIIPILLVNGSFGIGSGHSQNILPRNIIDITNNMKNWLNTKPFNHMLPYYNGFKGTIESTDISNQYRIKGVIESKGKTKTIITEVPITYDYKSYIKKLDVLIEKGIIKRYDDLCDPNKDIFLFTIHHFAEFNNKSYEDKLKELKLDITLSENLTIIDENNTLIVYNSIEEVFNHYMKVRLEYYNKRKSYQIKQFKIDIEKIENKIKFINAVNENVINIKSLNKKELEAELKKSYKSFDGYDYLTNMKIYNLQKDKIKELHNAMETLIKDMNTLMDTDVKDIWIKEINELLKALKIPTRKVKSVKKEEPKSKEDLILF